MFRKHSEYDEMLHANEELSYRRRSIFALNKAKLNFAYRYTNTQSLKPRRILTIYT